MSLEVLTVHTGDKITAPSTSFESLKAFQAWIHKAASIAPHHQILLLPNGKQAKFQELSKEPEVFLYNRDLLLAPRAGESGSIVPKFDDRTPSSSSTPAPDTITNQNDLASWRSLFRARSSWAVEQTEKVRGVAKIIQGHVDALRVMDRGVAVAVGNLESHISTLEHRYKEAQTWAKGASHDQRKLLDSMNVSIQHLSALPCDPTYLTLLPLLDYDGKDMEKPSQGSGTLYQAINERRLDDAVKDVQVDLSNFTQRISVQASRVDSVVEDASRLFDSVDNMETVSISQVENDASQLMEEIEVVTKKIATDCDHILELSAAPKSVSQASKLALMHTRNYLPSVKDYSQEMFEMVKSIIEQRKAGMLRTAKNMQRVASLEARFAELDSELKSMDYATENHDAFALVNLVEQLPYVYGALLLESLRRREQSRGHGNVMDNLAQEESRRKEWAENLGGWVAEDAIIGADLGSTTDQFAWPTSTWDELELYIDALRPLRGLENAVNDLEVGLQDLKADFKRVNKTAENDAEDQTQEDEHPGPPALFHTTDEVEALRDANMRLEDEIKGQKSRVRKLEDLLYRQSQPSRTVSSNFFPGPSTPPREAKTPEAGSPISAQNESLSRKASTASRRTSANMAGEDKTLARRIVTLEADLHVERQKRLELERLQNSRQDKTSEAVLQLEESKSTARDLMANLEAQQREFMNERRLLEDQIGKHKSKAEELEDELDRVLGSHDNSRVIIEERTRGLDKNLQQANQALATARDELKRREEAYDEQVRVLRNVHKCLAPQSTAPSTTAELVDSLEESAERALRQMRDLSQTVAVAKSEKEGLQALLDRKDRDCMEYQKSIHSLEESASVLRNALSAEQARATSLAAELEDGRQQLKILRTKFAEGETGSEALRQRVEEQAARASTLASQLAESKSHVNSLDVELSNMQRKHHVLSISASSTSQVLEGRTAKARELSNRLVTCYQELPKLLESLGLSTMRREGAMVIQRSSKIASQSTTLPDVRGSISNLPSAEPYDTTIDPSALTWIQSSNADEEDQRYSDLIAKIDDFSLHTFSEGVIKLRRDVEWTGKKWKMEARGYRDKYLRSQNAAHDKIAIRGFKEGDLALFLPTRNQATRPWAAFNLGAPHYFLREQDAHNLRNRDWLVARITKIEERVVDLSKTMTASMRGADHRSTGETSDGGASVEDDNPFELSDGLRWYLIDASEDKSGAPSTPGLGKTTVASAIVDVKGSIRMKKPTTGDDASTKLNKSLDSRRSSSNSKRGSISGPPAGRDFMEAIAGGGLVSPEGADVRTRTPGTTQNRPGSRSSAAGITSGPSGLGVEVMNVDRDGSRPTGAEDERMQFGRALLNAQAAASPPKGLLGLFGSPPRTWLRRGNSPLRQGNASKPLPKPANADGSPTKQMELSAPKPPGIVSANTPTSSPAKAPSQSSAVRTPQSGARSGAVSATQSPSKSPSRSRQTPAWASLYSLDVSLEEKGGKGAAKGSQ